MKRYRPTAAVSLLAILTAPSVHGEIAIQNSQSLAFGSFVAGGGGSVEVDTSGMRRATGNVMLMPSSAGQAAKFTITGDPNATYTIELPGNDFVKLTGSQGEMLVNDFTSTPSQAGGQLSAGGSQTLSVGAALQVGTDQAAGQYSGSFTVIVNYN